MEELIKEILTNLGTFGVVIILLGWWLRSHFDKRMSLHYGTIEQLNALGLEMRKERLIRSSELLYELQPRATACRNRLREFVQKPTEESALEISKSVDNYKSALYRAQVLVSQGCWDMIHRFKQPFEPVILAILADTPTEFVRNEDRLLLCGKALAEVEAMHRHVVDAVKEELETLEAGRKGPHD